MLIEDLHINKITIENYKSLRNSEIELNEGLNIIIGKNGAGKSNFLDFLNRYSAQFFISFFGSAKFFIANFSISTEYKKDKKKYALSYSIKKLQPSKNDVLLGSSYELSINKRDSQKKTIIDKKFTLKNSFFKISLEDKELYEELIGTLISVRYITFNLPQDEIWLSKPNRIVIDKNNIGESQIDQESTYGFFRRAEFQLMLYTLPEIAKKELTLDAIKAEILNVLSLYLSESNLQNVINTYSPIKQIRFNPNINIYFTEQNLIVENLHIDFVIDNDWIPWSYLSDGTKRIFYIISESLSFERGTLLIEEPELGIHPHQLYKILDFLKEQSKQKQVVISTHSPLALDVLNEKELNRIIIAEYDNGTKFRHLSKTEITKAKKYMTEVGDLSTYWLHSDLEK